MNQTINHWHDNIDHYYHYWRYNFKLSTTGNQQQFLRNWINLLSRYNLLLPAQYLLSQDKNKDNKVSQLTQWIEQNIGYNPTQSLEIWSNNLYRHQSGYQQVTKLYLPLHEQVSATDIHPVASASALTVKLEAVAPSADWPIRSALYNDHLIIKCYNSFLLPIIINRRDFEGSDIDNTWSYYLNATRVNSLLAGLTQLCQSFQGGLAEFVNEATDYPIGEHGYHLNGEYVLYEEIRQLILAKYPVVDRQLYNQHNNPVNE